MLLIRLMWKDWGFASTLFNQAKHFLDRAKNASGAHQEANVRASILFSLMSFEAYFFTEVIRGYIQHHEGSIDAAKIRRVEEGLNGPRFTGIQKALATWPRMLTPYGQLTRSEAYITLETFLMYRNKLVHGKISEPIDTGGVLAQDFENVGNAELAIQTLAVVMNEVALHFRLSAPTWL